MSCYDALLELNPSPVVALNRVVALSYRDGAEAGLAALDALRFDTRMRGYAYLPATRADLLRRAGRWHEAAAAFASAERAMRTPAERALMAERRAECMRALASGADSPASR